MMLIFHEWYSWLVLVSWEASEPARHDTCLTQKIISNHWRTVKVLTLSWTMGSGLRAKLDWLIVRSLEEAMAKAS